VRSKVDVSQLNLLQGTKKGKKWGKIKKKDMLRRIGKQSHDSAKSVMKQKEKATVRRIWRKGMFKAWS